MRIDIERTLCAGYGVCAQSAPEVFALDENSEPVILKSEVDGEMSQSALLAEQSCPMQAVLLMR
jgi:ferredoxin